jgi:YD repeat-containing protein
MTAGPAGLGPVTPCQYRLRSGLFRPLADPFTPVGTDPDYGSPVFAQTASMLARWRSQVQPSVPGTLGGPAELNPANGHLLVRLHPPIAGPFDPTPILVYNSQGTVDSEFGWGWTLVPKQRLTSLTSHTVNVVEGTGTSLRYRNKDGSNRYQGPGGVNDALVFNADQTWTQTQSDGFQVRYDATGRASRLATPSGDRWTLSYDGAGRMQNITDPFTRRTSFAYSAAGKIRRIQQPDGRITSLAIDGSDHLVGCVFPDRSRVTLAYNAGHGITTLTDKRSQQTLYGYNASG